MRVTNLIQGGEMRGMKGFRAVVEPLIPELEKEGLTREAFMEGLSTTLEKRRYQVPWGGRMAKDPGKSEGPDFWAYPEKVKMLRLTSGMGEAASPISVS